MITKSHDGEAWMRFCNDATHMKRLSSNDRPVSNASRQSTLEVGYIQFTLPTLGA